MSCRRFAKRAGTLEEEQELKEGSHEEMEEMRRSTGERRSKASGRSIEGEEGGKTLQRKIDSMKKYRRKRGF